MAKEANAEMTAGSLVGSVTLAVAVEEASVPLSGVLVARVDAPMKPTTVIASVVPTGTFVAAMLTVTGFAVVPGKTTSGAKKAPPGLAGAATPPTEVICRVGAFARVTDVGAPVLTEAATAPVTVADRLLVNPSVRRRPAAPAPPTLGHHWLPPPAAMLIVPVDPVSVVAISRT